MQNACHFFENTFIIKKLFILLLSKIIKKEKTCHKTVQNL